MGEVDGQKLPENIVELLYLIQGCKAMPQLYMCLFSYIWIYICIHR